ncbi:MAG: hypothetical protein ACI4PG_12475 [Candidatus Ventricola sp.]
MAQRRRQEQQLRQRQRRTTALCIAGGLGAVLLGLAVSLLIYNPFTGKQEEAVPMATSVPYNPSEPFTLSDLTAAQLAQIRSEGSIHVSDGPRGVSVGDPLDKLLERLPATIVDMQADTDVTGLQSDEEVILYCASYFENQNGRMTALPPRGLLTVDTGQIIVTLLAPTSAYPAGTKDSYGSYEHVYCRYTIEPDTMTIASIVLGIGQ